MEETVRRTADAPRALRLGIAALALVAATPVLADEAEEFAANMGNAVTGHTLARAYVDACDARYPEGRMQRRDVMAGWSHRVDLDGFDRLLTGAAEAIPGLAEEIGTYVADTRAAVAEDIEADGAPCHDLAAKLAEDDFDIERAIRRLLRDADDFGITVPDPPPPSFPAVNTGVMPLAALWTQALEIMEEIGSKAGAVDNRALAEAREDHLLAWLEAHDMVQVHGRVVAEDELREWRGDQQSRLMVSCSGFASSDDRHLMETGLGRDMVVAGEPRWVLELREGGVVNLSGCRLSTPKAEFAAPAMDDSPGLMLRPPEFEEAFAGPGAGIAMGDVDRVLYSADFTNRLDGFGNGYTDRQEDIYVLLRDGTAYRHDWSFAFTDLDVALSRHREPERWFTWSDHWGEVTLVQTGGFDEGRQIDLSDARRLAPIPTGQRLSKTYYFLNVGRGGARRDREYVFAEDGNVTYTRGGFIAGNFGTSFITIVPGDDEPSRLAYRFEGFTMVIDGPEGSERHFAAMIDGDDPNAPEELLIRGQVYWDRDDD